MNKQQGIVRWAHRAGRGGGRRSASAMEAALRGGARLGGVLATLWLSACSSPAPFITTPMLVVPNEAPPYVERVPTGAIFQAGMTSGSLFSGERKPRAIGDTMKVDISEKLTASNKVDTTTSRENKMASKGPGTGSPGKGNLLDKLINMDATASGSDAYKGSGSTDNAQALNAQLTVSVVNVMPNGHLVVAGERSMALNGGTSTLRFAGMVNPKDIKVGNIVASADVLNARYEVSGQGDVSDAASRNWLQRLLTKTLTVW
jgi:flagellar L-ring protein precursor FlgH